jgi:hypothetical protein
MTYSHKVNIGSQTHHAFACWYADHKGFFFSESAISIKISSDEVRRDITLEPIMCRCLCIIHVGEVRQSEGVMRNIVFLLCAVRCGEGDMLHLSSSSFYPYARTVSAAVRPICYASQTRLKSCLPAMSSIQENTNQAVAEAMRLAGLVPIEALPDAMRTVVADPSESPGALAPAPQGPGESGTLAPQGPGIVHAFSDGRILGQNKKKRLAKSTGLDGRSHRKGLCMFRR